MDVREGGRVAQHFDVKGSDQMLFDLFGRELLFAQLGFESWEFVEDDAIFLLLGFGLPDAFDELFEVFGEVGGSTGHYDNKYSE